ncbi:MAG: TMEM175 family protein [Allosphingosinicella sp.]
MAGEPELLSGDEPLAEHIARHRYDRTIMLADGVFAIAITLLALELRPPDHWDGDLSHLLAAIWRSLFAYLFGFAIVGAFWVAHRGLFARIRRVDGPLTLLALVQLCLIAMTPAVAALVGKAGPGKSLTVYFMLIVALGGCQALLWAHAAFIGNLVDIEVDARERRLMLFQLALPPLLFLALLVAQLAGRYEGAAAPIVIAAIAALAFIRRLRRKAAPGSPR